MGVHEVFVGGLVGVECGDGSIEVENKSLKHQDDEFGWRGCGDAVVTVGRGGCLVGVGGHGVFTGSP